MVTQTLKFDILAQSTEKNVGWYLNVTLLLLSLISTVSLIRGMVELDALFDSISSMYPFRQDPYNDMIMKNMSDAM